MKSIQYLKPLLLCVAICSGFQPRTAEAGPLLDWLFGRRAAPAYPVGQPVPIGNSYSAGYGVYPSNGVYANNRLPVAPTTNYGAYYGAQLPVVGPAGAGYTAPPAGGITAATLPTTSYVPNFRTQSYRAPVTYYRPLLTTDPNTGAQVVMMAPCTSYEYQTGRVPTLGRRSLYTPGLIPQALPAPAATPTYTLPSGGIPLATPQTPYPSQVSAYGSYSVPTPVYANPVQPSAAYSLPYSAGVVQGGCTGSAFPPASVPGLSAPPAGTTVTPAPTYGQPTTPPGSSVLPSQPGTPNSAAPGGVFPPPDTSGNSAPSLPSGFGASNSANRAGVQSFRSLPMEDQSETHLTNNENSSNDFPTIKVPSLSAPAPQQESAKPEPSISPIPVPSDFDIRRRWNPGLLREDDMTALRPIQSADGFQASSKKIHWASFEGKREVQKPNTNRNGLRRIKVYGSAPENSQPSAETHMQPSLKQTAPEHRVYSNRSSSPTTRTAPNKYDSQGWKRSR